MAISLNTLGASQGAHETASNNPHNVTPEQIGATTSSDVTTAINDARRTYTWVEVTARQCLVNGKYLSLGGGNNVDGSQRFYGGWMTVDFDALAPALPDIVYAKAVSCAVWLNESYLYHYPAGSQGHLVGAVGDNNNAWRYFSIMIDRPATTTNATSVVSSFSAVPGQARFHLNQAPGDDNTFDISAFNIRGYWK